MLPWGIVVVVMLPWGIVVAQNAKFLQFVDDKVYT